MSADIKKEDIEEQFIRSGGKGGQNVNKVATCVRLKHLPTGIIVKCETYRSQMKNRVLALRLLKEKVAKYHSDRLKKEESEFQKRRRRNRKRPPALKEKILKNKKINSEKKRLRKRLI